MKQRTLTPSFQGSNPCGPAMISPGRAICRGFFVQTYMVMRRENEYLEVQKSARIIYQNGTLVLICSWSNVII